MTVPMWMFLSMTWIMLLCGMYLFWLWTRALKEIQRLNAQNQQYLSTQQAADRLNVSTATVRRMIRQGELKARKVRRLYRVYPEGIK